MSDVYGKRFLKQKAVYWSPAQDDGTGLGRAYGTPIEVKCRWTDKYEVIVDPMGKEVITKAYILADRDLEVEGVLWLGLLADVAPGGNPFDNDDAFKIVAWNKIPDTRAKKFLRKAYM